MRIARLKAAAPWRAMKASPAARSSAPGTRWKAIEYAAPTGSEPAMFLVDLTDLGDRFFAAAFSVDPNFVPVAPEG